MKIYNVRIDAAGPARQLVNVPGNVAKYGVAVEVRAGDMQVAAPSCEIIDGGNTLSASRVLDDGSFVFDFAQGDVDGTKEITVHAWNGDTLSATWNGTRYNVGAAGKQNTDLDYVKNGEYFGNDGTVYGPDEKIAFTDQTIIQYKATMPGPGGIPTTVTKTFGYVPAGSYCPRELDRWFLGGSIGVEADCYAKAVLRETSYAVADGEIDDTDVTVAGKAYVPTALSVDGVEYSVLAESNQ